MLLQLMKLQLLLAVSHEHLLGEHVPRTVVLTAEMWCRLWQ